MQKPNRKAKIGFASLVCLSVILVVVFKITSDKSNDQVLQNTQKVEPLFTKPTPPTEQALDTQIYTTPQFQDRVNFAQSLEGTEIDGALKTDSQGNLVVGISVRDFFDYFLSASDEVGAELAIDEIVRYSRQYLPEPGQQQAIELLRNYLLYKKTELDIQRVPIQQGQLNELSTIDLLSENFSALKERRKQLFDEKQDQALFGLEDSFAEYTLASLQLRVDPSLSNEQKQQQLLALRQSLPSELASSINNRNTAKQKQNTVTTLLDSKIDDSQLHEQLLEQGVSYQKAEELVSHRQQQTYFESQYKAYKQAQQNSNLSNEALRKQFFTKPEDQTKAALRDLSKN